MSNGKLVRVGDIMKGEFIELDGVMTIKDAIGAMQAENASVLIVKKRHEHDEYGIVQLSDIAKRVLAKDRSPERVNVYEIMTKPALSVSADMNVKYCARLFERFGVSRAPVIQEGKIIGMVSYNNIVINGMAKDDVK